VQQLTAAVHPAIQQQLQQVNYSKYSRQCRRLYSPKLTMHADVNGCVFNILFRQF